jgi:chromosome segregation ATPase
MSGETEKSVSGWTVDTLREHILGVLHERDSRYEQRFEGQEKAIDKAEASVNERLKGMNEFRGELADRTATFPTRNEVESDNATLHAEIERNRSDISDLSKRIERAEGKGLGLNAGWGYLIAALAVLVALYAATH